MTRERAETLVLIHAAGLSTQAFGAKPTDLMEAWELVRVFEDLEIASAAEATGTNFRRGRYVPEFDELYGAFAAANDERLLTDKPDFLDFDGLTL